MGIIESVRGVMWARRNQPDDVAYLLGASHERFGPTELVRQAVLAEEVGFDGVACSDHCWGPFAGASATSQSGAGCCNWDVMLVSTVRARSSERCTAAARARSALASERSSVVRSAPNTTPATHSSSTANIM